jgi:hypothetical protein
MHTRTRLRGPWAITIAALVAALLPLMSAPAYADVLELPIPDDRCIASVASGFGLSEGVKSPADGVELNVPGPVVSVIVEWTGRDDADSGTSSLDIEVAGPGGSSSDPARAGTLIGSDNSRIDGRGDNVYSWWADITDLLAPGDAGVYSIDIEPFATPGLGVSWGGVVTAVYDTTPCAGVEDAIWKIGADYYFGGHAASSGTTELLVYDWVGAPASDLTVTVRAAQGGADSGTQQCRVSQIWAATGNGAAPSTTDTLVDAQGNAVFPGATRIVSNPFSPPGQSCPAATVSAPASAIRGGSVGPEYALVEVDIVVPAGSEWMVVQFESPSDNGGYRGLPESGAWAGGSVLHIPSFADAAPAIGLETTILDTADGACPGVAGVDESAVAEPGDLVTYCFRVTNPGTTPLFPVYVNAAVLGIGEADMELVAGDAASPLLLGGELVYAYEAVANSDLLITATATGTPSDAAGTTLALADVTATDDAALVVLTPGIALSKTVLAGTAAACPGREGVDELVAAATGTAITYCFAVTNTGEVDVDTVTISDPGLGVATGDLTLVAGELSDGLTPGETAVWSLAARLDSDTTSTATASATAADPDIADSVVTASDTAGVAIREGGVHLTKFVVAAGASCGGALETSDRAMEGVRGAEVRYCFIIANTGTVPLYPIMIDDPELDITRNDLATVNGDPSQPLPPGAALMLEHLDVIDQNLTSTTTVTATLYDDPASLASQTLAAAAVPETVTARATTTVELLEPSLRFIHTAVAGHETECAVGDGAAALTVDDVGEPVTLCFVIENTGDTALWPVELEDTTFAVGGAEMDLISGDGAIPLLPGATLVYAWRTSATGDITDIGIVTATAASPTTGDALAPTTTLRAENLVRVSIAQEELPTTGVATGLLALIATVLLGLGGAFVVASHGGLPARRRRSS